jgi:hypothetical protein
MHVSVDILLNFLITLGVRFLKCPNNTFGRIHSINMEDSFLKKKLDPSNADIISYITTTPINSINTTKTVQAPLIVLLSTACLLELQRPTCTRQHASTSYMTPSATVFCYEANRRVQHWNIPGSKQSGR